MKSVLVAVSLILVIKIPATNQVNFEVAFCDESLTEDVIQQRWQCIQKKLPPEIAGLMDSCQKQLAGDQSLIDYIHMLCESEDKVKELLSCIVEQLASTNPVPEETLKNSAEGIKDCLTTE